MSDTSSDLEDLRRRIDGIDDRIQDLLIQRMEIVARVAASKQNAGGVAAHQPAREAQMMRRLVSRSNTGLPADSLIRIWRELLAATTRAQGSFTIAVYAPSEAQGSWDLTRDHYGSHTQMLAYRTTGQVIQAVTEGQATVGVLPMPHEEDPDPWWRHLLSTDGNAPHVIARLPFGGRGNARGDGDALAIGRGAEQPTGRDRTLLVAENAPDISRGRMFSTLANLGLACTFMALCEHADSVNTLIEIDAFVPVSDPRLGLFRAQLGSALYRLLRLGSYAVPLSAAELGLAKVPVTVGFAPAPGPAVAVAKG